MKESAAVLALVDAMKARGVAKFTVDGVSVEFGPVDVPLRDEKRVDDDMCPCGHGGHEHNAGLCLRGCDVEKCTVKA